MQICRLLLHIWLVYWTAGSGQETASYERPPPIAPIVLPIRDVAGHTWEFAFIFDPKARATWYRLNNAWVKAREPMEAAEAWCGANGFAPLQPCVAAVVPTLNQHARNVAEQAAGSDMRTMVLPEGSEPPEGFYIMGKGESHRLQLLFPAARGDPVYSVIRLPWFACRLHACSMHVMHITCSLHERRMHTAHALQAHRIHVPCTLRRFESQLRQDVALTVRVCVALCCMMLHNCCRDSNRGDDEMLRLIRDGLRTGVRDRRECETHSLLPVEACIADLLEQLDGYIDLLCQAATYARHALAVC